MAKNLNDEDGYYFNKWLENTFPEYREVGTIIFKTKFSPEDNFHFKTEKHKKFHEWEMEKVNEAIEKIVFLEEEEK
jgi:hypothetical protein